MGCLRPAAAVALLFLPSHGVAHGMLPSLLRVSVFAEKT
jgi:hypothetical protein